MVVELPELPVEWQTSTLFRPQATLVTNTVTVSRAAHPVESVAVSTYEVLTVGHTVMEAAEPPLLQEKVKGEIPVVLAVSVTQLGCPKPVVIVVSLPALTVH